MARKVYVYKHANEAAKAIQSFIQNGGDEQNIKVLVKNVEHGEMLEATTNLNVHIDYLYEITAANRIGDTEHDFSEAPIVFAQQSVGQASIYPGLVGVGNLYESNEFAIPSLVAYGLPEGSAEECLKQLRAGYYLLFVDDAATAKNKNFDSHPINNHMDTALDASFETEEIPNKSYLSAININGAASIIDID